ncbi:MAG: hypothetical protein H7329_17680 [Opitutaceae bacterium]|nr:hypothetical protein [Cytophagales bacterium]
MKVFLVLFLCFYSISTFAQNKKKPKVVRDQYNIKGNATIKVYYNTPPASEEKRKDLIAATSGNIGNQKDAIIVDSPDLRIGTLVVKNVLETFRFGGEPVHVLRVMRHNKQYQVSIRIRDSKGDEIANVLGRTWQITNTDAIEYNNDDSGFEIRTSGRVIFQLDIRNSVVHCNGMFCTGNGSCNFIMPASPISWPPIKREGPQRFNLPNEFVIKPLFMYPRSKFLGVRYK